MEFGGLGSFGQGIGCGQQARGRSLQNCDNYKWHPKCTVFVTKTSSCSVTSAGLVTLTLT